MFEHASELRGFLVVAREEGAALGSLSAVQIDPQSKCVVAIAYKTRRVGGDEYFVSIDNIEKLGRDVVIVSNEQAATRVSETTPAPGRALRDLLGMRVTAMNGSFLGALVDIDFSPNDWVIRELVLAEDKHLPVVANEIEIGDEILVPSTYVERLQASTTPKEGFLRRTVGSEWLEGTKNAIKRALRRSSEEDS